VAEVGEEEALAVSGVEVLAVAVLAEVGRFRMGSTTQTLKTRKFHKA
jgi:hypothetical protein